MTLNSSANQLGGTTIVAFVILAMHFLGLQGMAYDRATFADGAFWQLITANFVHPNWPHVLLNLFGILCIAALHRDHYALVSYLIAVLLSCVATIGGLFLLNNDATGYLGLSGVLHGLLAWGIAYDLQKRRQLAWILGLVLLGKLSWETINPESSFSGAANLYGAVGGIIAYMLDEWFRSNKESGAANVGAMATEMNAPVITTLEEKYLIGLYDEMSLAEDKTSLLWQTFMRRRSEIENRKTTDYISLRIYKPELFNPQTTFTKWAAVEVESHGVTPEGLEAHTLRAGLYAVFTHLGPASAAPRTFQFIFGEWMPQSDYELDFRDQFEVLPEGYDPMDPDATEKVWIPIRTKL